LLYLTGKLTTGQKIILSGVIGNLLESFDVMICAYFAKNISGAFFPPSDKNIFYTFLIFCAGYLAKPVGGLLIGLSADQAGRKRSLTFSILLTGICTALIGILPSWHTAGILSLYLFLTLRILQNISVGGEYISSISYLVESAERTKRGFYGSWISVGFNGGTLLASLSAWIILSIMEAHPEFSEAWRVVFLLALTGTGLGYWIRRSLPESIGFILENQGSVQKKSHIIRKSLELIKSDPAKCLSLMAIAWLGVCETSAIFVYSPIHLNMANHFSQKDATEINTLSLVLLTATIPIFGFLYDRINRITLIRAISLFFSLFAPVYFYFLTTGSWYQVLVVKLLISIPSACYYALATVYITESFPVSIRCTSLAFIYQTTASVAAGVTPFALFYLAGFRSLPWLPGIIITLSGFLCIYALRHYTSTNIPLPNPSDNIFPLHPSSGSP